MCSTEKHLLVVLWKSNAYVYEAKTQQCGARGFKSLPRTSPVSHSQRNMRVIGQTCLIELSHGSEDSTEAGKRGQQWRLNSVCSQHHFEGLQYQAHINCPAESEHQHAPGTRSLAATASTPLQIQAPSQILWATKMLGFHVKRQRSIFCPCTSVESRGFRPRFLLELHRSKRLLTWPVTWPVTLPDQALSQTQKYASNSWALPRGKGPAPWYHRSGTRL